MGKDQEECQVSHRFGGELSLKMTPSRRTIPGNKGLGQWLADPGPAVWQTLNMACTLWATFKGRCNAKMELFIQGEVSTAPLIKMLITACECLGKQQVRAKPPFSMPEDGLFTWPSTSQKDHPLRQLISKCITDPIHTTPSHSSFQPTRPHDNRPQLKLLGRRPITSPFHDPIINENRLEFTLLGTQEVAVTQIGPSHQSSPVSVKGYEG